MQIDWFFFHDKRKPTKGIAVGSFLFIPVYNGDLHILKSVFFMWIKTRNTQYKPKHSFRCSRSHWKRERPVSNGKEKKAEASLLLFSLSFLLVEFLSLKRASEKREEAETQTLYHEVLDHTMENSAFVTITKLKGKRKRNEWLTELK